MSCCFGGGRSSKSKQPPLPVPPPATSVRLESAAGTAFALPGCDPVRLLGEGTFGTVVLVRERSTGVYFAVKIMSKAQLTEEDHFENVITERRVLREAGPHPFVIECHSGFQTADAVVLVLEYLSGGDMYDLLKANGTLSEAQARFYIAEILIGLEELHRFNFVFRDLKLENILLDEAGHVRLTDFGLTGTAKSGGWDDRTITDISGTAIYQAPEILSGEGHGRVVDFWALGVLAFVILTGRPPFSGGGDRLELNRLIQETDIDLGKEERLEDVSDDGKAFIQQLLQRDPSKRLGSADDGQAAIRGHPFMKGIDWDAMLKFDVAAPLPPPLSPPSDLFAQEGEEHAEGATDAVASDRKQARDAERHVFAKLTGHGPAKPPKASKKMFGGSGKREQARLDSLEYKFVDVGAPITENGRVSIGLDFRGRNETQKKKTWTGTTDDFGRVYSPETDGGGQASASTQPKPADA